MLAQQPDELRVASPFHEGLEGPLPGYGEGGLTETWFMAGTLGEDGLVDAGGVQYGTAGTGGVRGEGGDLACGVCLWRARPAQGGEPVAGRLDGVLRRHLLFLCGF